VIDVLRRHLIASATGLATTLVIVLLQLNTREDAPLPGLADVLRQVRAVAYDLRLRATLPEDPSPRQPVVVVDVDEASLAAFGQWPWPRRRIAELIERLDDAGAAVVAFDVVFAEAEENPVDTVLDAVGDRIDAEARTRLADAAPRLDGDVRLADAIDAAALDVVLGIFVGPDPVTVGPAPAGTGVLRLPGDGGRGTGFLGFSGWVTPEAALLRRARVGHVVTIPDDLDGVIRRAPLLVRIGDALVPSLALQAVLAWSLVEELEVEWRDASGVRLPTALRLGDALRIPVDDRGRVLVPYRGGPRTYPYLSAADVLTDHLDPGDRRILRDAIVLVGSSSIGLADLRSTPTAQVFPGVEVHATIADALLEASERAFDPLGRPAFPVAPDLVEPLTVAGLLGGGVVLSLVFPLLGPLSLALLAGTLATAWVLFSASAWRDGGVDLPIVMPVLLILAVAVANLARGFLRERAHREALRGMFEAYVPPAHIDRMVSMHGAPTLEGESRVMTVLFADIQGFTRLSEGLPAPELKRVLNEFFTPVTRVILGRQGTIDKYVGDMIMAFWNAPLVDPDHREHAMRAALEVVETVSALEAAFAARGLPPLRIGIGLNTGPMNVGDMGSDFRRAYTVIGDAVNLASRIEGLTRQYGVSVLVGEQTRDETPDWAFRMIDRVQVKGRTAPVRIYEPLGPESELSPARSAELARWHAAYWKYLERDFEGALAAVDALVEEHPDERLFRVYRARIEYFLRSPPDPAWDGVTVMEEK
jgi:adenylate cyclase